MDKIKIGISSCLLGRPVRFDGGHKHDRWITGELGRYVEFVPVCPEVEAGFGVPRESMRLVGDPEAPRLVTTRTGRDLTPVMAAWAKRRADELAAEDLCGFIFKSKSPSSGMTRVKVYSERTGMAVHKGVGLFARAFMERFPLLPVEEEGRLLDARLRENFIERIFVLRSWREVSAACARPAACTMAAISGFHARYETLLLEALGRLATVPRNSPRRRPPVKIGREIAGPMLPTLEPLLPSRSRPSACTPMKAERLTLG